MNICVIGGGPAGMIAAIAAADNTDNKVTLIERNEKLGKKLFLTGKGRCNLTNSCDMEELFNNVPRNPKFLYSAFYDFNNRAVMDFFEDRGLRLKEERGNRVFPASDHSSDVIATLAKELKRLNVKILLNTEVMDLIIEDVDEYRFATGVVLNDGKALIFDKVIVSTGGKSYPSTGSDAKFMDTLKKAGVTVGELLPSLVPLVCDDDYISKMQGLSLKNVEITMYCNNKKRYSSFGGMLFTHFGLSGPLILSASANLNRKDYEGSIFIEIDLKPALSEDELDKRVLRDFNENQNKYFENSLDKLLPSKMIPQVIKLSGIDGRKRVNLVTKEERLRLVKVLKHFPVNIA